MATLKGFGTEVGLVDMAWGTFNTGFSVTIGWLAANAIARKGKAPL